MPSSDGWANLWPGGGQHWHYVQPDEIAIDRMVHGDPPAHTYRTERWQAFLVLDSRNLVDKEIARRLGCDQRTVQRYRAQLRKVGSSSTG